MQNSFSYTGLQLRVKEGLIPCSQTIGHASCDIFLPPGYASVSFLNSAELKCPMPFSTSFYLPAPHWSKLILRKEDIFLEDSNEITCWKMNISKLSWQWCKSCFRNNLCAASIPSLYSQHRARNGGRHSQATHSVDWSRRRGCSKPAWAETLSPKGKKLKKKKKERMKLELF